MKLSCLVIFNNSALQHFEELTADSRCIGLCLTAARWSKASVEKRGSFMRRPWPWLPKLHKSAQRI